VLFRSAAGKGKGGASARDKGVGIHDEAKYGPLGRMGGEASRDQGKGVHDEANREVVRAGSSLGGSARKTALNGVGFCRKVDCKSVRMHVAVPRGKNAKCKVCRSQLRCISCMKDCRSCKC